MRNTIIAAGMALGLTTVAAHADPISFSSNSQFTNPGSGVSIVSGGNEVDWPSQQTPGPNSAMYANDLSSSQTANTTGTHRLIGSLSWYNAVQSNTTSTVTFDYQLTLNFTVPSPGGSSGAQTIDLTVHNTPDTVQFCFFNYCSYTPGSADTAGTFSLPSFTVDGLLVSNISFAVDGSNDPGSFSNGIWTNPETATSTLDIYADINKAPAAVPEPASLALLGAGLCGLGLARRKRLAA